MRFKFVGNPYAVDNRGELVAFGIRFPLNVEVDVAEPAIVQKLMGNHHFAAVCGRKTYHQAPKLIKDAALVDPSGAEISSEEDKVSGFTKSKLIEMAEQAGIKIDKRWNPDRIAEAISAGPDIGEAEV